MDHNTSWNFKNSNYFIREVDLRILSRFIFEYMIIDRHEISSFFNNQKTIRYHKKSEVVIRTNIVKTQISPAVPEAMYSYLKN